MTDPAHDCAAPGWTPDDLSPMFWRAYRSGLASGFASVCLAALQQFLSGPWDNIAAGAGVLSTAFAAYSLGRSRLLTRLALERKPKRCTWHYPGSPLPPELMPYGCVCNTPRYSTGGSCDNMKEIQP